jgi:hypothetical protein
MLREPVPARSAWRSGPNGITFEGAIAMIDAHREAGGGTRDGEPCDAIAVGDRVIRLSARERRRDALGTVIAEEDDDVLVWFEDHIARPVARVCLRRLGVAASTDRRRARAA